jgi:hypothetical protein
MTPQLEGAVRSLILAVAGVAGSFGYMKDVDWVSIASGLVALIGLAWSLYSNSTKNLVSQASESDEVKRVVVSTDRMADSIPSTKVVSSNSEVK